jgi:N-acyl-D-amino-acid deacylase
VRELSGPVWLYRKVAIEMSAEHDLVIRNGTVVDGTGAEPRRADVAVTGNKVAAIGEVSGSGRQEIDADGHVVTPGFIDGHTHMDAQVFWDTNGTSSCWHGITTVVMGNCGFTLAPAKPDERALVIRNLERAEDISPAAMAQGINWTWDSFGEYLNAVDRLPKGINYAAQVGHSALRTWAMGERAFEDESSEADLDAMCGELRRSLEAGAIGFTTSRSAAHETSDNRPVASRMASWEEVRRLVQVMGDLGSGVFELTPESAINSADPGEHDEFCNRLRALAVETGVPVSFGIRPTRPELEWQLALIDATVAAGGRMFAQTHSRGISGILSFETQLPFDKLPEWKAVRTLPLDEQRVALRDPEMRRRLVEACRHGDYGNAIGAEARAPDFDLMIVLQQAIPPNPTVSEMARARGCDPVELIIDLAVESDFKQMFLQPFRAYQPDDLVTVMKHPQSVMTFSDSGAHVSQIVDCSIQTHLLSHWVRNENRFTLTEAVRMLTQVPALAWGFSDRGVLAEGYAADINVFDPDRVAPELPIVVNDLPGGGKRLIQKATGFLATVVAGEVTLRDGEFTGATPGRLLRGKVPASR